MEQRKIEMEEKDQMRQEVLFILKLDFIIEKVNETTATRENKRI